jgi:hypothetical protein
MKRAVILSFLAACGGSAAVPDATPSIDSYVGIDGLAGAFCDGGDGSLVGCYAFEPGTPPTALDDGSYAGNTGSLEGGSFVPGYRGMAAHIVPATSRIVVPDSATLDVTSVTIEAWIEMETDVGPGGRETIVDDGDRFALYVTPGNIAQCAISEAGAQLAIDGTFALQSGAWQHVACTYDAATRFGVLYVNGPRDSDGPGLGRIDSAGAAGIVIGGDAPCGAAPCANAFSGSIDQLRIWNRARTQHELCADANAPAYLCPW